jgi:hypothetical protein
MGAAASRRSVLVMFDSLERLATGDPVAEHRRRRDT